MTLNTLLSSLESFAPLAFQEDYDNSGLLLGDPGMEVSGALVSLDLTPEIILEAVEKKCNLVISHHPFIFQPLKKVTPEHREYEMIRLAILHGVALVAIHTNVDNSLSGLNAFLCRKIGLQNTAILAPKRGMLLKLATFCPDMHAEKVRLALFEAGAGHIGNYDRCSFNAKGQGSFRASDLATPFVGEKNATHFENETRVEVIFPGYLRNQVLTALKKAHPYEEVAYDLYPLENEYPCSGSGMIGSLPNAMPVEDFLLMIKMLSGLPVLRHSAVPGKLIRNVAVCSGSGAFLIPDAVRAGADVLVTADLKYHDFQAAEGRILLTDFGHFESEHGFRELISAVLKEKFPNFAVLISEKEQNPVRYF
jgi:dinuclear metal center YbgI/SA1388 family protein